MKILLFVGRPLAVVEHKFFLPSSDIYENFLGCLRDAKLI
jgi:hypothetical protein